MAPQHQLYVAYLLGLKVVFGVEDLETMSFAVGINEFKSGA